jgi:hypothetical protein
MAPVYELPFGPGRALPVRSRALIAGLAGKWQAVLNTTFMKGVPLGVPGGVCLPGDPTLSNPAWDRMVNTGYIDADGTVCNALPGERPVFPIHPPFARA